MREARTPDIASTPLERDVSVLAIPRRGAAGRLWSALLAAWGVFIGLLPHVLHHVGPLAGAALLAGAGGTVLFAAIGFVAAIPFLRRLHRRFATWKAPAIALAIHTSAFGVCGPSSGRRKACRPSVSLIAIKRVGPTCGAGSE